MLHLFQVQFHIACDGKSVHNLNLFRNLPELKYPNQTPDVHLLSLLSRKELHQHPCQFL